ncbi:tyrosine-protein phosphatase non-receptor type 9-like [Hetaerina americana]|uniref:tyrosine-protein phosphatase non-receptor type 9-like n=1 Tax=Hetaerina americana TaxID=62018 RepID=UPI003A7F2F8C
MEAKEFDEVASGSEEGDGGTEEDYSDAEADEQPPTKSGDAVGLLTPHQRRATKEFLEAINCIRGKRSVSPVSWSTAVRFLWARKWDVGRAVSLHEVHEATRRREGLTCFHPGHEPLHSELRTGKFTILPTRDVSGAAIAVFTARLHYPAVSTHQTTLQGVVYQLDVALESIDTQRSGLIFIYDMTDSKYSNFDYDLSQKILTLLKGGYPAKLKKVLIVTAPLWFKAPFKILRLFVREKLRDRVYTVSVPQLTVHIAREALPPGLGGTLKVDHNAWLRQCAKSMTNRQHEDTDPLLGSLDTVLSGDAINNINCSESNVPSMTEDYLVKRRNYQTNQMASEVTCREEEMVCGVGEGCQLARGMVDGETENGVDQEMGDDMKSGANTAKRKHPNCPAPLTCGRVDNIVGGREEEEEEEEDMEMSARDMNNGTPSPAPAPSSASSGFSDDDSLHCGVGGQDSRSGGGVAGGHGSGGGLTLEGFVEQVRAKGRVGLCQDYTQIRARPPDGTFNHARLRANLAKNRYTDVLCYDHSRVLLSQIDDDPCSDYINANFVDGYKQKNAFISSQGPLPKTYEDFWRMIWEQHVLVVVMTTRVIERGRIKCGQYWSPEEGSSVTHGLFEIITVSVEQHPDYTISSLQLTNTKLEESREVRHLQFTSWPDYGVPHSALAMLHFLECVRLNQSEMVQALSDTWAGHPRGPPIVVHCSAGIGRTGTFCTLDICLRRLEEEGTVDVQGTVERIRAQRAHSIQMPDQYVFCHLALIEHALSQGLIPPHIDLSGFDDSADVDSE